MKILISTDSSCLLKNGELEKLNIRVFPLNVIVDGVEYLDGVTIRQEQLKEYMLDGKQIKTSTPPLGTVIEYFEGIFSEGYDKVIHFTISSKLSSMYSLFANVSSNFFDGKIVVVDSYAVSSLMLSHVLFAYDKLQEGVEPEKIKELIEERKNDYYICFTPENLTALKNGGRISPSVAAIGNTIGLKPILTFNDGELGKEGTTLNMKKVFIEKINKTVKKFSTEKYDFSLVSFGANEKIFNSLKEHFLEEVGEDVLITGGIPINICAHCGPGTIGYLVTPKINGKSIKDFI